MLPEAQVALVATLVTLLKESMRHLMCTKPVHIYEMVAHRIKHDMQSKGISSTK